MSMATGRKLTCMCMYPLTLLVAAAASRADGGWIDASSIYTSANAPHIGEYSDLPEGGAHLALDLYADGALTLPWTTGASWRIEARDLGLATYAASVDVSRQGQYRFELDTHGSRQFKREDGRTPYIGEGSLTLPAVWIASASTAQMTAFDSLSSTFRQQRTRETVGLAADWVFNSGLSAHAGWNMQTATGKALRGGSIYVDAARGNAALLPTPIDHRTRDVTASVTFSSTRLNGRLGWQWQRFDNRQQQLQWDNAFVGVAAPASDFPDGRGALTLAPDHDRQALRVDGNVHVIDGLGVQFDAAWSHTRQDDSLAPFTINPGLTAPVPVPLAGADAELTTVSTKVRVNYRPAWQPLRKLSVRAAAHYDQRDHDKPRRAFDYVRGDGADQPAAALAIFNTAHDVQRQGWNLRADYRLSWWRARVSGEYRFDQVDRENAAVRHTRTDTWRATLRLTPVAALGVRTQWSRSDRRASNYRWEQSFLSRRTADFINATPDDQRFDNHPLLRQFNLANAQTDTVDVELSWAGLTRWYFAADLRWQDLHYDRSQFGLTETQSWQPGLEVQFTPRDTLNLFMHATFTRYQSDVAGRAFGGGIEKPAFVTVPPLPQASDPARDWFVATTDDVWTAGAGLRWQFSPKLEFEGSVTAVASESDQRLASGGSQFIDAAPLPTVRTRLTEVGLKADYRWRERLSSALEYRYTRYAEDDYALDDVLPTTLPDVLGTGAQADDEVRNLVTVSLRYEF